MLKLQRCTSLCRISFQLVSALQTRVFFRFFSTSTRYSNTRGHEFLLLFWVVIPSFCLFWHVRHDIKVHNHMLFFFLDLFSSTHALAPIFSFPPLFAGFRCFLGFWSYWALDIVKEPLRKLGCIMVEIKISSQFFFQTKSSLCLLWSSTQMIMGLGYDCKVN